MSEEETPSRRSRDQLRELVMNAAIDLVRREGLGAVATTLSYQRVFDHLEATEGIRVTRASVHERIWDSQQEFQMAVLSEIDPWNTATPESLLQPALRVFDETHDVPTLQRMQQMTRTAAQATQTASEQDPLYYAWVGMTMLMAKDSSLDEEDAALIAESVRIANREIIQRTSASILAMGELLGVRPRSELFPDADTGWRLLINLGAALSEGATLRTRFDQNEMPNEFLHTGPDGELQEWSAFAIGYWALLQTFLEEDPDARPGD